MRVWWDNWKRAWDNWKAAVEADGIKQRATVAIPHWEYATQELAEAFVAEYFEQPKYGWVGGEVGGVLEVNDYFFKLQRMVEALSLKATFEQLIDYYELEAGGFGKSFSNYVMETEGKRRRDIA